MPRFDKADQNLRGAYVGIRREKSVHYSTYDHRSMSYDTFDDFMGYLKKKREKCRHLRDMGFANRCADMVNAATNELSLLAYLEQAAKGWLHAQRKCAR